MMAEGIKDKTAIVGIGWTEWSRNSGTSVTNLAAEASLAAIDDAGLTAKDVDGIITHWWRNDSIFPRELARAIGIEHSNYEVFNALGGSWSCAAILTAAMAVHSGICRNVLVFRAMNGRSEGHLFDSPAPTHGRNQFTVPFGVVNDATVFAHYATAHMARYGTTTLDFAHVAVTQREHARLNTKAIMREPITVEDHQRSRWIVYPYRLLDCCLVSDGGAAVIVTSTDNARHLRDDPVPIMAGIGGGTFGPHDLWETNGKYSSARLYDAAGIRADDIDFAEIYDPFTFMAMVHMEDFGLVDKGGVGDWVRAGQNALDGDVPVNTHGGLLSEAYLQGMNHVIEAVQQLRASGVRDDLCGGPHSFDRSVCRQVRDAQIGLVAGERGDSALVLRRW